MRKQMIRRLEMKDRLDEIKDHHRQANHRKPLRSGTAGGVTLDSDNEEVPPPPDPPAGAVRPARK